ncbi:MAG: IPTL-CTERM sorting domain-containing protein [Phycisphaerae bacterium]|nr:IPTL-CTERM sorting domain-containing protein [Phycisphaerae bacterium]
MVDNVSVVRSAPSIPTVSEWGLIVMMLLILTAGSIVFMRRSQHQVA